MQAVLVVESDAIDMGKKLPAGMKTVRLYNAQSVTTHGPLLRKGKDDPPPPESFVDDVKRKVALKKVMTTHSESLFDNSDDPVDGQWEKEDVNYRYASDPTRACEHCEHFIAPYSCEIVAGLIRPVDVCDKFEPLEKPGFRQDGTVPSQLIVQSEAMAVVRRKTDYVQEWLAAQKDPAFKACMTKAEGEVSPPGWSGSVKAMKKHADISNPWALAWYMHNKGASPHYKPEKKKSSEAEGGPGSGPQKGYIVRSHGHDPRGPSGTGKGGRNAPSKPADMGSRQKGYNVRAPGHDPRGQQSEGGPGSGPQGRGAGKLMIDRIRDLPKDQQRKAAQHLRDESEEGGPGSGPKGGKSKFAPEKPESDEDRQVSAFTRREKPGDRKARIKQKKVDPHQAKAIQRAFLVAQGEAVEGVMGTMADGLANPQPDHQQFEWTGLSHGRRGDT